MSVLKYMLLTFQHSHEAFHLVRAPACCPEGGRSCVLHRSGWRPDMLSLLGHKGLGLEAQDLQVLDVRTGGDLRPNFTDRKLRPKNECDLPMGPQ